MSPTVDPGPVPSPTSGPGGAASSGPSSDQAYVGLTEQEALAEAEEAGVPVRVVQRDGESLPVTMDYREDRLDLVLEDGRVTAVRRG